MSKQAKLPSSLTEEEFGALKRVADKPLQRAISDEHRNRLIATGYIREVRRRSGNVYALVPTPKGLRLLRRVFTDWDLQEQNNALPKKDVRSTKYR